MKAPSSFLVILFLVAFLCGSLSLVKSQDSCSTNVEDLGGFFSFNVSSLKSCVPVWEAQDFILRYTQASPNEWNFVLSYPLVIDSYVAMGFSSNGNMVGSSAIVTWTTPSGLGTTLEYYLGGTSSSQVVRGRGDLHVTKKARVRSETLKRGYMAFQLQTERPQPHVLYAIGPPGKYPTEPSLSLSEHMDKISTTMDYKTDKVSGSTTRSNVGLRRGHGVMNMIGWSLLMITGVIIARYFKQWDPIWFHLHASIQGLAFIVGLVGILCGISLSNKVNANVSSHKGLAIFILVLGCLQVMAFILRPGVDSKIRKYWSFYHHNVGRILIIFAIVNTFYGIHLGGEGSKWFAGYGIALAILVIVAIVLEIRMRTRK